MTLFVGTFEVKYNGPINLKNFYRQLHDWVVEQEFVESNSNPLSFDNEFYCLPGSRRAACLPPGAD